MRRKSQRGATKVTPEKPAETATRRSRRHSKRRKRSSSRSSNEDSHETPPPIALDSQQTKSPEQPQQAASPDDDTEEPVWKVKATAAPSGEIQKIKLCLTRPVLSSPEKTEIPSKRRRNKSSSRIDEDVTSSEDVVVTPTRKSRHRGSSGIEIEEVEDKKGKGKSKSKNKSKHDKSQEIQEVKDETQNEISENIQVTPQSPQAASDIRVDNEIVSNNENDSINEDSNAQINIANQFSDSTIIEENKSADVPTSAQHLDTKIATSVNKSDDESESHTPTNSVIDDASDSQKIEESSKQVDQSNLEEQTVEGVFHEKQEETVMEIDQIEQNQTEEVEIFKEPTEETKSEEPLVVEASSEQVEETETCSKDEIIETKIEDNCTAPVTEEVSSEMQVEEIEKKDCEVSDINEYKDGEVAVESENKVEVQITAGQGELISGSICSDEADKEYGEKQLPILEKIEITEDSNHKAANEKQLFDEEAISVDTIINLNSTKNDDDVKEDSSCTKIIRKRKWGKSLVGLELTYVSKNINMETIKELCPTLKFLEESEIQIELKDRRKSADVDRTSSRKVSIEYKTNDRLETQTSVSSEISEPMEIEIDNSNIIAMNRKISIVDDTASKLQPPPSPAKNPISQVLYITNLVRPFTLKQLKELLERTGKLTENGFWTDRIKSKCYVCYETIEEAEATRNALHGVHWPICNGKKLVIEYASPEELDKARNPTPPPVVVQPVIPEKEDVENQNPTKRARLEDEEKFKKERPVAKSEQHVREWDIGKEDLHRRRSRSRSPREVRNDRHDRHERNDRRKYKRSLTPIEDVMNKKKLKEDDVPQKLMDDLFQRTKATPSIYWLPLTPEEIATKQQQRLLRMAEHKRRMEESSRSRGDYGRGVPYRRRYD